MISFKFALVKQKKVILSTAAGSYTMECSTVGSSTEVVGWKWDRGKRMNMIMDLKKSEDWSFLPTFRFVASDKRMMNKNLWRFFSSIFFPSGFDIKVDKGDVVDGEEDIGRG